MQRVRADIRVPGQGDEAHEAEHCYLSLISDGDDCPIGGGVCRFGLTEIVVPNTCPLRLSAVDIKLSLIREAEEGARDENSQDNPRPLGGISFISY